MDKNKKKWTVVVLLGVLSAGLLALACWWSVQYNDARLVAPTDLSTYVFRVQDLPMLLAGTLFTLYILSLVVLLLRGILTRKHQERLTTRSLNPKLGFLGLLGFLGFAGFWSYPAHQDVTPFVFFLFFGLFGFFYEGKLSNTFMDERFLENRLRAQHTAMRVGFGLLFLVLILAGQGRFLGSLEYSFIALLIAVSLVLGLVLFLSEYLLYRYDHDEEQE
ncbi:MAG: DUF3796 domain-containing protein [Ruminiclostridium sp.]|jgi:uncharacterized protein involved in response to NO|nr:DUF3796 domain-containing protein [Ruminiclostridium sp.]